jgi:hypothetical protein
MTISNKQRDDCSGNYDRDRIKQIQCGTFFPMVETRKNPDSYMAHIYKMNQLRGSYFNSM